MKYRKKPIYIEAVQWFKDGDHPEVKSHKDCGYRGCNICDGEVGKVYHYVESNICPKIRYVNSGDYIINTHNDIEPCSESYFHKTYEKV